MIAEIITIGDEILIGQIIDTNSAFIAKKFNAIGIEIEQITSIQDEEQSILSTLKAASERSDIIIITGGLGPTKDDITKNTLCKYFNDELVYHSKIMRHVEALFQKTGTPISALNKNQAQIPSKATVLHNHYGTAPGMWIEEKGTVYVSLPGVPYEMKALIENEVIPKLQDCFERPYIIHKTILTYGEGESAIAEKIQTWEEALPNYIKLAYLPGFGRVRLRLSARGNNEQRLIDQLEVQIKKLHQHIGNIIRGYEDSETIEQQIGNYLTQQQKTIVTAESCTGGRLAAKFTENSGASAYYKGSIVTYATSTKKDILQIPDEVIKKHSVVSAEITKQMAMRARKLFNTDYALATTGNAGPAKGDSNAEIGTVFIALATPKSCVAHQYNFGNQREKVTQKAVNKALELILDHLHAEN